MRKNKFCLVDGFDDYLVEGATFEGKFAIPKILGTSPSLVSNIEFFVPFSQRKRVPKDIRSKVGVCFFEHDVKFHDFELSPNDYLDELREFAAVISPDNSMYTDDPLSVQLINLYRNRAYGYYMEKNGINVIPNIRWGDARSYSLQEFGEAWAFSGAPHESVIAVGSYGCIRGKEASTEFRNGLKSAMKILSPKLVLVYGPMPERLFDDVRHLASFVHYDDWTKFKHKCA